MSDNLYENLPVHLRHVPEPGSGPFEHADAARAAGYDTINPVTGVIQVGVEVNGHFLVLFERKAPGVLADIKRAQQQQQQQAEQQQTQQA